MGRVRSGGAVEPYLQVSRPRADQLGVAKGPCMVKVVVEGAVSPHLNPSTSKGPPMLPPFIIEQIRKREERQREERPFLELPLEEGRPIRPAGPSVSPSSEAEQKPQRGVIVVDL